MSKKFALKNPLTFISFLPSLLPKLKSVVWNYSCVRSVTCSYGYVDAVLA